MKRLSVILLVMTLACALSIGFAAEKKVTVGNKNFTEQYIVGQMMKQVLEANGFTVELVSDVTTFVLREGMVTEDIDICADYTGTAWMTHLGYPYDPAIGHEALYAAVKAVEKTDNNFIWLNPMWNHNSYALAVWPEFAEENNIETMSDLAELYNENDGQIDTFIDFEFSQRPDGLPALEKYYDFHIDPDYLKTGAPGASVMALDKKQTKVGMVFATDSKIAANNWVVLRDNKHFWPPYDLTPYVNADVLKKYPEIEDILNEMVACFPGGGEAWTPEYMTATQKAWSALNGKVDIEKMDADEAAHEFLVECGLVE